MGVVVVASSSSNQCSGCPADCQNCQFNQRLSAPPALQWHRMPTTQETDGFQVKRPGDVNVKCTLLLMLDHQVALPCPRSTLVVGLASSH